MTFFDAILLGIVEGVTEFLPISSTGHLLIASALLGLPSSEFLKTFTIAIQLGAITSVVVLYWRSFLDRAVLSRVLTAFVPTGLIGFFIYPFFKSYLLEELSIVLWSLALGGIALIVFELLYTKRPTTGDNVTDISYAQALWIGLCQAIAIIPGVSRSGASIVGGLVAGVSRVAIVHFSFLLAVPTIAAATGYDLLKTGSQLSFTDFELLAVGFFVSFIVALGAMKFLLAFIRTRTFIAFGIYRIIAALLFFIVFF